MSNQPRAGVVSLARPSFRKGVRLARLPRAYAYNRTITKKNNARAFLAWVQDQRASLCSAFLPKRETLFYPGSSNISQTVLQFP